MTPERSAPAGRARLRRSGETDRETTRWRDGLREHRRPRAGPAAHLVLGDREGAHRCDLPPACAACVCGGVAAAGVARPVHRANTSMASYSASPNAS